MKTEFTTLAGTHFESNDSQTYFYAIYDRDGKQIKKRIKKHEFEQAQMQDEIEKRYAEEQAANQQAAEESTQKVNEVNYCRHPHGEDLSKPVELNECGLVDCSKCNVQDCVHRDCMRRNPVMVGGLGECPRLKVETIDDWNDVQDSRNAWSAVDEVTYDVVADAIKSLGKTDDEVTEIMALIGKDASMVMDFNEATSNFGADEFNSYIKSRLYSLLNGEAKEGTPEAKEDHLDAETTENTTATQNAKKNKGNAKKKVSRKKNIGYTFKEGDVEITLTEKQVDFIHHLPDTCYWENGLDSVIWVDCLCDEIGGQFAKNPFTVGAMVSTICEKGLGVRAKDRINGRLATSFGFTEIGKKVAAELGLR